MWRYYLLLCNKVSHGREAKWLHTVLWPRREKSSDPKASVSSLQVSPGVDVGQNDDKATNPMASLCCQCSDFPVFAAKVASSCGLRSKQSKAACVNRIRREDTLSRTIHHVLSQELFLPLFLYNWFLPYQLTSNVPQLIHAIKCLDTDLIHIYTNTTFLAWAEANISPKIEFITRTHTINL